MGVVLGVKAAEEQRSVKVPTTFDGILAGMERCASRTGGPPAKESKDGRRPGAPVALDDRSTAWSASQLSPVIEDDDSDDSSVSSAEEFEMANADFEAFISTPREDAIPIPDAVEILDLDDPPVAGSTMEHMLKTYSTNLGGERKLLTV